MSFFKNLEKTVSKAAGQVAKVAVTPLAAATAVGLDSVGLRGAASKLIDKTALNKKQAASEKKAANAAGFGVDAIAVGAAAYAVGPTLLSAGGTALKAGAKYAGSALKAAQSLIPGLSGKSASSTPASLGADINQTGTAPNSAPNSLGSQIASGAQTALKSVLRKGASSIAKDVQNAIAPGAAGSTSVNVEAPSGSAPAPTNWLPIAAGAALFIAPKLLK